MSSKNFQVVMEPRVHEMLKHRAKQNGIKIGEMIGNLVSLLEAGIEKGYKVASVDKKDDETDRQISEAIFYAAEFGQSEKGLYEKFKKIGIEANERNLPERRWRPAFTYGSSKANGQ
jgi:hypothetical protein